MTGSATMISYIHRDEMVHFDFHWHAHSNFNV